MACPALKTARCRSLSCPAGIRSCSGRVVEMSRLAIVSPARSGKRVEERTMRPSPEDKTMSASLASDVSKGSTSSRRCRGVGRDGRRPAADTRLQFPPPQPMAAGPRRSLWRRPRGDPGGYARRCSRPSGLRFVYASASSLPSVSSCNDDRDVPVSMTSPWPKATGTRCGGRWLQSPAASQSVARRVRGLDAVASS